MRLAFVDVTFGPCGIAGCLQELTAFAESWRLAILPTGCVRGPCCLLGLRALPCQAAKPGWGCVGDLALSLDLQCRVCLCVCVCVSMRACVHVHARVRRDARVRMRVRGCLCGCLAACACVHVTPGVSVHVSLEIILAIGCSSRESDPSTSAFTVMVTSLLVFQASCHAPEALALFRR